MMAWQCPVCEEWSTRKRVSPVVRVAMAELDNAIHRYRNKHDVDPGSRHDAEHVAAYDLLAALGDPPEWPDWSPDEDEGSPDEDGP